ncbi:MAG: hypothetical protein JRI25_00790 [Deltaproteobacteria bacterium]|nr:hypothetical protein [Deltaproteobacteria bacterium]
MRILPELLQTLANLLPPWLFIPLLAVLAVAAVPAWIHWLRTKQIRGHLRGMFRATDPHTRHVHEASAYFLALGKPRRLVVLAEEAIRLNLKPLWQRALTELETSGKVPAEVRRLRAKVEAVHKRGSHPLEEVVIIERMWDEGLHDAALERLAEVGAHFPGDPDLTALEADLRARPE